MKLKNIQLRLPWTIKYSRDFRANPQPHKDFAHAILHAQKALGKLASLVDDMDHDREIILDRGYLGDHMVYIADLVICALRMANTFPGQVVDLEETVVKRIEQKNGVEL